MLPQETRDSQMALTPAPPLCSTRGIAPGPGSQTRFKSNLDHSELCDFGHVNQPLCLILNGNPNPYFWRGGCEDELRGMCSFRPTHFQLLPLQAV